jgi:hypothetical protein
MDISLTIIRILLTPLALLGLLCIWIYVLLTMGYRQANGTIWNILEL